MLDCSNRLESLVKTAVNIWKSKSDFAVNKSYTNT